MSYSRVVQPRGSAVQRQRGGLRRPQASSYDPQPVNRAEAGHVEHPTRDDDEGEELGERSDFQGRATGRRSRDEERRVRSHGGHYVLSPDQTKNEKLRRTAREEAEEYERHKATKMERVAARLSQERPRALGGQALSQREVDERRQKQEREQYMNAKFAGVRKKQKREEYQIAKRQREDKEIEKRKQIQREKAVRLEEKQRNEREVNLDELRRKRLARFGQS